MTVTFRRFLEGVFLLAVCAGVAGLPAWLWPVAEAHPGHGVGSGTAAVNATPLGPTPCVNGFAGGYPCARVNVESFLPTSQIGGGNTNDIWGWTDAATGKEYALVGRTNGTSFVDISNPGAPVYLGNLPTHSQSSTWRGIKVYANHAFVVSEAKGHGLQVFDLTQLRDVVAPPRTFAETAHYSGFATSHTVAINEETGFLYAAGSNTCAGGLHIVDIRTPAAPAFAGCFSADGYTHDTQCVLYHGPDMAYAGREICFNSNENTLTIVDVTEKTSPVMLARKGYAGRGYTHQGWLTEDHGFFLLDDEFDETNLKVNTRTHLWDVSQLRTPVVIGVYEGASTAIDHNQYVRGNHVFQSNYTSGLRVLDVSAAASARLREIAFFDVRPEDDAASYVGTWSNFPFFTSGVVVVASIERGLFVLRPTLTPMTRPDVVVAALSAPAAGGIGLPLEVTDSTANQGAGVALPSHTEFFLSPDGLFSLNDAFLGERDVPTLTDDGEATAQTTLTIPADTVAGKYYIIALGDSHNATQEEIENNNARPRFINIGPDLLVPAVNAPSSATPGSSFAIIDTAKNTGGNASGATSTRLFLSRNSKIDGTDTELAVHPVPPLDPNQTHSSTTTVTIPSGTTTGLYYLIAHLDRDNLVAEFAEDNNTRVRKITLVSQ